MKIKRALVAFGISTLVILTIGLLGIAAFGLLLLMLKYFAIGFPILIVLGLITGFAKSLYDDYDFQRWLEKK